METENVLFVCTGNVCRSAMAEALAPRAVPGECRVRFRSAGFVDEGLCAPQETVEVMSRRRLDVKAHRSSLVEAVLEPAPDLVITMAREHLRLVVAIRPELFPRTFTLKELVRLAEAAGSRKNGESLDGYLTRIGEGRQAAGLLGEGYLAQDDVADPIGRPVEFHETVAAEIESLIEALAKIIWNNSS